MMDAAYFVGRRELLDWINTTLELNVGKVEETCNGAVACQLLDCVLPGTVAMSKVNWAARDEYAMINNYKLLQSGFGKARVSKPVEVNKLIRGKYQDNLEFMQWFKAFFDAHGVVDGYDPVVARRKSKNARAAPELGAKAAAAARAKGDDASAAAAPRRRAPPPQKAGAGGRRRAGRGPAADENAPPRPPQSPEKKAAAAAASETENAELLADIEAAEGERDFYFKKLQAIEAIVTSRPPGPGGDAIAEKILRVLYESSSDDLPPYGEAPAPANPCSPILEEGEAEMPTPVRA